MTEPSSPRQNLTRAQRRDWLRLIRAENVGPRTFRSLVARYGGAAAALEALPHLAKRGGRAGSLHIPTEAEAEAELDATEAAGARYIALGEPGYPRLLRKLDDPPPLLCCRGTPPADRPAIAIVGSRSASAAGLKMTERLAQDLGAAGLVVVSGLARGIDAAAHRGSLATGTVAVVAGGLERLYPPEHAELAAEICAQGAVVSEMPLYWQARAQDFPRRNRIVSGMALGVVVVEAATRSGSLITARMAAEQGRRVFAVPGSPIDPRSGGTNDLLKKGAVLVTEASDVLTALERAPPPGLDDDLAEPDTLHLAAEDPPEDLRAHLAELIGPVAVTIDDLARLSGAPVALVRVVLVELELAGRVRRDEAGAIMLA